MEKKKLFGSIIAVIAMIVVVAGATFAFYTATASSNNVVNGTAASASMSLDVTLESSGATGNLVPQLSSTLATALAGTSGTSCVDGNGNTVCKVYKIIITNTSNTAGSFNATFTLSGGTFANLKWEILTSASARATSVSSYSTSDTTLLSGESIAAGSSKTVYVVVWIAETGSNQNTTDTGSFIGTVDVNNGSSGLTSTFTS